MLVEDEAHIHYGKGALVMHAIADLIGEEALNRALRSLYIETSAPGHAATTGLLSKLRTEAPPDACPLIERWLSEIVLHDAVLESSKRELQNGTLHMPRPSCHSPLACHTPLGRRPPLPAFSSRGRVRPSGGFP